MSLLFYLLIKIESKSNIIYNIITNIYLIYMRCNFLLTHKLFTNILINLSLFCRVRLDDKLVDVLLSEFQIFIRWTQEHVLLFYPNFIQEFTCGLCTSLHSNTDDLYKKIPS